MVYGFDDVGYPPVRPAEALMKLRTSAQLPKLYALNVMTSADR
jgi:hypothetical protein